MNDIILPLQDLQNSKNLTNEMRQVTKSNAQQVTADIIQPIKFTCSSRSLSLNAGGLELLHQYNNEIIKSNKSFEINIIKLNITNYMEI